MTLSAVIGRLLGRWIAANNIILKRKIDTARAYHLNVKVALAGLPNPFRH